jgi:hypothetical protein
LVGVVFDFHYTSDYIGRNGFYKGLMLKIDDKREEVGAVEKGACRESICI